MRVFTCRSQGSIFAETQQKGRLCVLCWMRRNFIWRQQQEQQELHWSLFQHHSDVILPMRSTPSTGERSFMESALHKHLFYYSHLLRFCILHQCDHRLLSGPLNSWFKSLLKGFKKQLLPRNNSIMCIIYVSAGKTTNLLVVLIELWSGHGELLWSVSNFERAQ